MKSLRAWLVRVRLFGMGTSHAFSVGRFGDRRARTEAAGTLVLLMLCLWLLGFVVWLAMEMHSPFLRGGVVAMVLGSTAFLWLGVCAIARAFERLPTAQEQQSNQDRAQAFPMVGKKINASGKMSQKEVERMLSMALLQQRIDQEAAVEQAQDEARFLNENTPRVTPGERRRRL